jgi:hypothetical protein
VNFLEIQREVRGAKETTTLNMQPTTLILNPRPETPKALVSSETSTPKIIKVLHQNPKHIHDEFDQ